jgi:cell division protein FtsI (penicillin-binding protein 3)
MTDRNDRRPPSRKRFFIFIIIFGLTALVVLGRYTLLMLNPLEPNTVYPASVFAERGPILDRNGRILALQTRIGNISARRPEIEDLNGVSRDLAPILEIPADEIRNMIALSATDFVYIKKQVDRSTIREIERAKSEDRLKGISIEPIVGRIYPEKQLASQIIGFVGDENVGLAGIEYAFDSELAPAEARATGGHGNQVILTIDSNVQHILENIARKVYRENAAEAVMLMAMDPRNGDVLGSASLPDFDPNEFRTSNAVSRMDRPAIWAYEPGSVFKIFSLSALMDSEAISSRTIFTCNGHYERTTNRGERVVINCLAAHGPVTARDIIVYSCNAGAAYAADRLGAGSFYELLRNFGFGARTGAGNPGETAGVLHTADDWSDRSKPTIAMGQEIAVSALQMLQAASAIANDGILIPPRIVSRIVSPDGETVRSFENGAGRQVLKAATARAMRSYMTDVTSNIGTGWRANVEDLSLAVKTGTAQSINPVTGAYSATDFIASCIALVPAESPSLVLYLVIVRPKGEYLGGRIATPPIREAAEALAEYLGIPRGRNPQLVHSPAITLPPAIIPNVDTTVPDFLGYSKRQILPLLLRDDITIELEGDGWVRRQSPPPGTPLNRNTVITLELE